MKLEEYQDIAYTFAAYNDPLYPVLALAEECGELSKVYAKALRGDEKYIIEDEFTDDAKELVAKELGDVLWMVAAIASENGMSLDDIAELNIQKLTGRKVAGVIKGDGDYR